MGSVNLPFSVLWIVTVLHEYKILKLQSASECSDLENLLWIPYQEINECQILAWLS